MKPTRLFLIFSLVLASSCMPPSQAEEPAPTKETTARPDAKPSALPKTSKPVNSMPYAWPFLEPKAMSYRGGTTTGSKVTLDKKPSAAWKALRASSGSTKEKDRLAILAMVGDYRVSFQFVETLGFADDYTPPRPYFSWGTEEVRIIEDREDFISLQHTLVMFFKGKDGKIEGPMVMKHWRQDWSYEDTDLHTFRGDRTWERSTRDKASVTGAWTQTVYQVDDSPRYEVVGKWSHNEGVSSWTSEDCWRPLPRREFSVRDDYNVLGGSHTITITPTGWVHAQDNRKLVVKDGKNARHIASETGINRYERITDPDLKTGSDKYWIASGPYWTEVRKAWAEVYKTKDRFSLEAKVDGQALFMHHFGYAMEIEKAGSYDAEAGRKHAQETIQKFLK